MKFYFLFEVSSPAIPHPRWKFQKFPFCPFFLPPWFWKISSPARFCWVKKSSPPPFTKSDGGGGRGNHDVTYMLQNLMLQIWLWVPTNIRKRQVTYGYPIWDSISLYAAIVFYKKLVFFKILCHFPKCQKIAYFLCQTSHNYIENKKK